MRKFGAASLFLMSILLAGVITPATSGFQMFGFVPTNTYVDFAFAQTEESTDDESEEEAVDETEDETESSLKVKAETVGDQSEVKVELEFVTDNTNPDLIIDEIIDAFALTREQADTILEIEQKDDDELEEKFEVEITLENEFSEAEVKLSFIVNSTDRDVILDTIVEKTILTAEQINSILELEIEESEEEAIDDAEDEIEETEDEAMDDAEDEIEDEIDNLGQGVSDFVLNVQEQFRAQKEETRAIIDACRDAVRNAAPEDRADIRMQCREDLNDIRESYQQLRRTYHDVFKEFRDHVRVLVRDAQGISDADTVAAIEAINMRAQRDEMRDRAHELRMQMQEELRAEVADLREQMREEREMMRDEIQKIRDEGEDREELESIREQMREEQEKMREQMQEEREKLREQMQEERENLQEEREKMREQMQEEREKMMESEETEVEPIEESEVEEEAVEESEESVEESEESEEPTEEET